MSRIFPHGAEGGSREAERFFPKHEDATSVPMDLRTEGHPDNREESRAAMTDIVMRGTSEPRSEQAEQLEHHKTSEQTSGSNGEERRAEAESMGMSTEPQPTAA